MKRKIIPWATAALVLLGARPAHAWDEFGHSLVARIAWENMTPQARALAIQILRGAPAGSGLGQGFGSGTLSPERQVQLFVSAAVWPDEVRGEGHPGHSFHRRDRHFVNLFWRQRFDFGPILPSNHPEEGDLLKDVPGLQAELTGSDPGRAAVALAWIIHLTGDIHQPLHASARITPIDPEGDHGGNDFKLERISGNRRRSLHSFWDGIVTTTLMRRQNPGEPAQVFFTRMVGEITARHPRSEFTGELGTTDFRAWAQASVRTAQRSVYRAPLVRNRRAPDAYARSAFRTAEPRIALAGYRLADLLNQAIG